MLTVIRPCCLVILVAACAKNDHGTTDSHGKTTSLPGTSTASTSTATTSTASTTSTTSPTTSTASESTSAPICGDGLLDPGEICDDGNKLNGDGCNVNCSPSGAVVWTYQPEMPGHQRIAGITVNPDGALFIAGLQSDGGIDKWAAQIDPASGAMIWSERYDHGEAEAILGIAATQSTIYAVGGTITAEDNYDVWIAGLDLAGKISWEDTFSSGFGPDYATDVVAIAGGDAIVAGVLSPELPPGGELWVRRYTADGSTKWTSVLPDVGTPLWSLGPGISAGEDRVVVGYAHRISADLQPEMLVAYSLGGGPPSWNVDIPNTHGVTYGVAHTSNNELVAVGRANFSELVVRRLSADGNQVQWESLACAGGTGRAVVVDSQGDIVVIGDGDGAKGSNIRLCKFTPEGVLRWGRDIDGGFGDDRGYTLALTSDDAIVAGGAVTTSDAATDAWLVMYSP